MSFPEVLSFFVYLFTVSYILSNAFITTDSEPLTDLCNSRHALVVKLQKPAEGQNLT